MSIPNQEKHPGRKNNEKSTNVQNLGDNFTGSQELSMQEVRLLLPELNILTISSYQYQLTHLISIFYQINIRLQVEISKTQKVGITITQNLTELIKYVKYMEELRDELIKQNYVKESLQYVKFSTTAKQKIVRINSALLDIQKHRLDLHNLQIESIRLQVKFNILPDIASTYQLSAITIIEGNEDQVHNSPTFSC